MKKLVSLVLVLALALSLSVPAFAADLPKAYDSLNDTQKKFYNELLECINLVVNNDKSDFEVPKIEIPYSELGMPEYYTAKDIEVGKILETPFPEKINNSMDVQLIDEWNAYVAKLNKDIELVNGKITETKKQLSQVIYALQYDYPNLTYWTLWYNTRLSGDYKIPPKPVYQNGEYVLRLPERYLCFWLTANYDYRKGNDDTKINSEKIKAANESCNKVNNDNGIVKRVAGKSTYEKVTAFKNYICENNVYNTLASKWPVNDPKTNGDPWQLIYVFDGHDDTNVVCAGYAKAFKYLCDSAGIPCYCVLGDARQSNGQGGPHAWNIVKMDNGNFYHVDITWCDGIDPQKYGVEYHNRYFLKGVQTSVKSYIVPKKSYNYPSGGIISDGPDTYTFDQNTFNTWGSQLISQLSTTDYVPAKITFNTDGHGTAPDAKIVNYHTAAGELPAPTANGFTFEGWYNGTTEYTADSIIDGPIELTAKWTATTPTTHSVAVNPTANGTASVSKPTAAAGEEITVTATPASGYELDSITVTPSTAVTNGKFTMPGSDVTVTVTFKAIPVAQLTGTVTISGTPKVGETLTATVTGTNNSGTLSYQWKAGGTVVGTNKTTYQPTAADVGKTITCVVTSSVETGSIVSTPTAAVIAATVPQPTAYNISVNSMTNGTASVSKPTAAAGEEITVTATPANGYELDSITVTPSTTVTNGKFTMPASDVTVTVTFKAVASTPDPEPTPTPTPTPDPEPDPEPTPAPNPEPTPEPEPSTPVNPDPGTTPEPSSKPSTPDNTETKQEPKQETKQETTISLNRSRLDLNTGNFGALTAAVTPSGSVTWSSSDTRVVTVDSNGSYFATGAGSATISVSANGKTATCYVTVTDPTFSANYTPYIPSGTQTTQSGTQTGTRTPGVGSETTNTTATPTTDVFTTVVDNPDGTRFTVVDNRNGISSIVQKDSYGQLLFESVTYSTAALARSNSVITAPETVIPAYTEAGATEIQFTMPQSSGKQTVRIPVENATDTTVAVAMNMVGPSEPILDSHIEGNYLVFTTNGSATVKVIEGAKYFDDVSSANWFNSAVAWVSSHGVMVGTKANLFSPYANITRAQMAQLLYNLSGTSSETVTSRFSDIGGHWYDKSVSWAVSNGLVSPQSQSYFGATADATRADMVTALYRYAKANGVNTSARADLSKFSDAATLTGEARDAMSWAVGIGLVNGSTQNNSRTVVLDPQGTVTRAQMATLMMRYCGMFA